MPSPTDLERLRKKAAALPLRPGVYLMKNRAGLILYIGKSRCLRNRVTSYFTGEHNLKTTRMVENVADFDTILCDSEIEALALENTLIKQHTPRYNIKLKDAKSYPYIKVPDEPYPHLLVSRERKADRARYFGPYAGTSAAYAAADAVNRIFRLPVCRRVFPRDIGRERPCLYRQMGRCLAPCTGKVSEEEYRRTVEDACDVLEGNVRKTVARLEEEMRDYAQRELYEEAAHCRDGIRALLHLTEHQKAISDAGVEQDVLALFSDEVCGVLARLVIRDGKLCGKNEFLFSAAGLPESESLVAFLYDFYRDRTQIPRQILLDFPLEDGEYETLSQVFSERAGRRIQLRTPQRGPNKKLCEMARANAEERAARYREECVREDKALITLCHLLGLEVLPDRIEAYDISNLGSEHIHASMVVYEGGGMKKADYRSFRIEDRAAPDDYASMREVLTRRLSHIGDGSPSLGTAPDLILLDGGATHVRAGLAVLRELNIHIPLFCMVKDEFHKTRALTDGENEIRIAGEPRVYAMIYKIQEEAHRFAVRHTMSAKRRTLRRSKLEDVPGIGPVKARKLLAAFSGIQRLRDAREDDIAAVRGLTAADAASVYRYFHPETSGKEDPS